MDLAVGGSAGSSGWLNGHRIQTTAIITNPSPNAILRCTIFAGLKVKGMKHGARVSPPFYLIFRLDSFI
jgi:hypothetical protein